MIDSGLGIALATDYNPGSSPSGNMKLVLSIACVKMGLTPNEAVNAASLNGAYAMGLSDTHGSVTKGKTANLFVSKPVPSLEFLPYAYGSALTARMIINGKTAWTE
jgi:imidazolonepropionase